MTALGKCFLAMVALEPSFSGMNAWMFMKVTFQSKPFATDTKISESSGALLNDCTGQMLFGNGRTWTSVLGNERLNVYKGHFSIETLCHRHHTNRDALHCDLSCDLSNETPAWMPISIFPTGVVSYFNVHPSYDALHFSSCLFRILHSSKQMMPGFYNLSWFTFFVQNC